MFRSPRHADKRDQSVVVLSVMRRVGTPMTRGWGLTRQIIPTPHFLTYSLSLKGILNSLYRVEQAVSRNPVFEIMSFCN